MVDFRLGWPVTFARSGPCFVLVEFNAFAVAFVDALIGTLRTRPRVDRVSVRFALREIMENRLSDFAAATSDNYVPLSCFKGERAHWGCLFIRGI